MREAARPYVFCLYRKSKCPFFCFEESSMTTPAKAIYTPPSMQNLGSFENLTRGGTTGTTLDASFPRGTPFGDLTFS